MPRLTVVFDNPTKEKEPWVEKLCAQSKLVLVDNDKVAEQMGKDEEARKALIKEMADPVKGAERLAPHYKKALEFLYGNEQRLAMYGTAWVVYYQPVDACIVDWSEIEKKASTPTKMEQDAAKELSELAKKGPMKNELADARKEWEQSSKAFVQSRMTKYVRAGRSLELPPKLSEYEKSIQASAFLRKLGIIS